jgi:hypothetical protein
MKVNSLPLDTWVVVEPTTADDVKLLSKHATQCEAEAECTKRNSGLTKPRYQALRVLSPTAGNLACTSPLHQVHRAA